MTAPEPLSIPAVEWVYIQWAIAVRRHQLAKARGDFGGIVVGELRVERSARRLRNALRWHGMEEQRVYAWVEARLAERLAAAAQEIEEERERWDAERQRREAYLETQWIDDEIELIMRVETWLRDETFEARNNEHQITVEK